MITVVGHFCFFDVQLGMSCYIKVCCPRCGSDPITRAGKSTSGEQRYRCRSGDCSTVTFMLNYRYKGYEPGIKEQIVDMALNGSGIRDTARVLGISKNTVIAVIKKSPDPRPGESGLRSVNE